MFKKAANLDFLVNDFSMGMDWTTPPARVGLRWLVDAKNVNLTTFKSPEKRGGCVKLYSTAYSTNEVETLYEYSAPTGTKYLLVVCGTKLGYYGSGAWHDLVTLTDGLRCYLATLNGYCFGANGTDAMFKIRNTTGTTFTTSALGIAAPTAVPTVTTTTGTLTGSFKWVYAYKRSSDGLIGNYSTATAATSLNGSTAGKAVVTITYSANAEVDYVVLYRTFDLLDPDNDSTSYFKVTEIANVVGTGTTTINDETADNSLTTQAENDNTVPPLAKFLVVHKDRMIYAHCPGEANGGSLFMISKVGQPEAVPSANYHYFDREDGTDITGIASLPDYLIVFKKNKIAVMEGEFEQWYPISSGIGCIAPWCIINLGDKVVFLSEEGIKCTDGRAVYDIGKKLQPLARSLYLNETAGAEYTGCYYPEKKQFHINLYHASYNAFVLVGHWLASLYMEVPVEYSSEDIYVGWTYHDYPNHYFYSFGTYTDSNGITRLVAGSTTGFIYQLDSGYQDESYNVNMIIETGWFDLGAPPGLTKTLREINVIYAANNTGTVKLYYDVDFVRNTEYITLTGGGAAYAGYAYSNLAYAGVDGTQTENLAVDESACGRVFRFRVEDTSGNSFMLFSIQPFFRVEGIR
jgi:hypothetical protein